MPSKLVLLAVFSALLLSPVHAAVGDSCMIASGQRGRCLSTSTCGSQGGNPTPGFCKGTPSNIQCCSWGSCKAGGQTGLCIPKDRCTGKATAGLCPGPADVQCCTYGSCHAGGKAGTCERKSTCGGTSTSGLCPGPNEIQCCTSKGSSGGGGEPATPAPSCSGYAEVNEVNIDLIKGYEKWEPSRYLDPSDNPTIGYGHLCAASPGTCSEIPYPIPLSVSNGEKLLQSDLLTARRCLSVYLDSKVQLNANQYGALVSWTFNMGCGQVQSSTLVARLKRGDAPNTVAREELPKWNKARNGNGVLVVMDGLVKRRAAEVVIFVSSGHPSQNKIAYPKCL